MAGIASSWKNLADANKTAWNAAAPSFPYIDKFGNPQTPSGYQLFCTLNFNRLTLGLAALALPPMPGTEIGMSGFALAITNPQTYNLTWVAPVAAGYSLCVFGSPHLSEGITVRPSRWKLLLCASATSAQPANIQPLWEAAFGYEPQDGRIWLKITTIIASTGQSYGEVVLYDDIP